MFIISRNCHFNREFQKIRTVKIGGNQTERAEFSDNLNEILGEQGVAQEVQRIIKEEVLSRFFSLKRPKILIFRNSPGALTGRT